MGDDRDEGVLRNGRGLVLGDVQSGKTANFSAVLAKAAGAGYRLVIVLSGTTNSLREQTLIALRTASTHAGAIVAGVRPELSERSSV